MKLELPPVTVTCPCGMDIEIPVQCALEFDEDNRQHLNFEPDYADLWAHSWTHDTEVNFEFDDEPDGAP